jgi:hypothetical protein
MTARRFDAMVIGGGLVGSAIAWGLRREGLSVALLDEGDAAYRASRGNFGLVWVQSKGLGAPWYQRWTRQSAESWAELANDLAKQTGQSLGLSQPGGLHLCLSDREMNERAQRLEQMKREAGNFDIQHIPYRGGAQSLPAMIGGQVSMSVDTLGSMVSFHKAGKLRVVAIATAKRSLLVPDVPTVDEAIGTRGFESVLWNVIAAPARLPPAVTAALAAATAKVMADPSLHQQLSALAIEPTTDSGPAAATAYIRAEIEKWRPVVEASGIKL